MGNLIDKPHDRLFKLTLQNVDRAKEFFNAYLPEKIKQQIDFSTLKLAPTKLPSPVRDHVEKRPRLKR